MITRRGFLRLLGGSLVAAASLATYAVVAEPMLMTRVKRYAITPTGWPKGLRLTMAVLTDIHACRPWMTPDRIRQLVDQTNALGADIIVLLGDYVSGMRFQVGAVGASEWAPALAGLKAPHGVFSILGNHDWWDDLDAQRTGKGPVVARVALERIGIPVLENDVVRIEKNGEPFWIAGLGDQLALLASDEWNRMSDQGMDDLEGTLGKVSDDAPVVLLAHEPDIFPRVPDRVALTLSGHTHGGQVRLFGYSPVVPSEFGNRFAYGHIVEDNRNLIVSGGLGNSIMPVRFGMRPEIVTIELG